MSSPPRDPQTDPLALLLTPPPATFRPAPAHPGDQVAPVVAEAAGARPWNAVRWLLHPAVLILFALAWLSQRTESRAWLSEALSGVWRYPDVRIDREEPLEISLMYDDPEMVGDEELAAVLDRVVPRFDPKQIKPNFVEHALRIWTVHAEFLDPQAMSGAKLQDFLVNHGAYLASWGDQTPPLLVEDRGAVQVRWGSEEGASVHHDHWLASLTEAGVLRHERVFVPSGKQRTVDDVIQQAIRDFRVDEREAEWSVMAFGLWLPPVRSWKNNAGREISFDLLAQRLLRGAWELGVCHGTHKLYSLMVLIRLDNEYEILSAGVREDILLHLQRVRDTLLDSQFPDGHWPSNWQAGKAAVAKPISDELYRQVISTGHHLEWLAIAPPELHPPRERLRKAARWLIDTTTQQSREEILQHYTFYSHVGNALAMWRKTRPPYFWYRWEREHLKVQEQASPAATPPDVAHTPAPNAAPATPAIAESAPAKAQSEPKLSRPVEATEPSPAAPPGQAPAAGPAAPPQRTETVATPSTRAAAPAPTAQSVNGPKAPPGPALKQPDVAGPPQSAPRAAGPAPESAAPPVAEPARGPELRLPEIVGPGRGSSRSVIEPGKKPVVVQSQQPDAPEPDKPSASAVTPTIPAVKLPEIVGPKREPKTPPAKP